MDRDVKLFSLLAPGETAWDAIHIHGATDLMPYVKRDSNGKPILTGEGLPVIDGFRDKFRKLRPDRPCPTIMAHMCKDANMYIHPQQARALTVREAARAQSFPDAFVFLGGICRQFTMVGNAVPPLLAQTVARAIRSALSKPSPDGARGQATQRVPTNPAGVGPERYGGRSTGGLA